MSGQVRASGKIAWLCAANLHSAYLSVTEEAQDLTVCTVRPPTVMRFAKNPKAKGIVGCRRSEQTGYQTAITAG